MKVKLNNIFVLVILCLNSIFYSSIVYASDLTFNNLEKARNIHASNPKEAHRLIDEGIEYYKKNQSYLFPWLGNFYAGKAQLLIAEKNHREAIKYYKKSCDAYDDEIFFQDRDSQADNLLHCYSMLGYLYRDIGMYQEQVDMQTLAINIYDDYDKYHIDDYNNINRYMGLLEVRSRGYEKLYRHEDSIKDLLVVVEHYSKTLITEEKSINIYLIALSSLADLLIETQDYDSGKHYKELYVKEEIKYGKRKRIGALPDDLSEMFDIAQNSQTNREEALRLFNILSEKINILIKDPSIDYKDRADYIGQLNTIYAYKGLLDHEYYKTRYINDLNKILSLNDELTFDQQRIYIYEDLIDYYSFVKDYKQVRYYYNKANILINKQIKYHETEDIFLLEFRISRKVKLLFSEAYSYLETQDTISARNIMNELKVYMTKDTRKKEIEKQTELNILHGNILTTEGNSKEAIRVLVDALDTNNKLIKNLDNELLILNNLSLAYKDIGNAEYAEKYMKKVIDKSPENINKATKITNYNNYAAIIMYSDSEKAKKYLLKAYNIFKDAGSKSQQQDIFVNTVNLLAQHHVFMKEPLLAEQYLNEAYDYVINNIDYKPLQYSDYVISYVDVRYNNQKDLNSCITLNNRVISPYEIMNNRHVSLLKHYKSRFSCQKLRQEDEKAFNSLFKMMKIIIDDFDKNNLDLQFETSNLISEYKPYVHGFVRMVIDFTNNNPEYLDKYKNIDFFDLSLKLQQIIKTNKLNITLSQAIAREMSKDPNISKRIKVYTDLISKRNDLLNIDSINKDDLKYHNNKLNDLDSRLLNLKNTILQEYPDFKNNFVNQNESIKSLQGKLDNNQALLHISVGPLTTLIALISHDNVVLITPGGKSGSKSINDLIMSIRESVKIVNNKPNDFDILSSKNLYDIIFTKGAVEFLKGKQELIIVPDGPLYSIPFDLLKNKHTNKWLIEDYSITMYPSLNSFVKLNDNIEFSDSDSFLGLGNPKIKKTNMLNNKSSLENIQLNYNDIFSRRGGVNLNHLRLFPELPETETELKNIADNFDKSKIYVRENFNETLLKSIDFNDYKVISFASHALVVGEIDSLSEPAIVLSLPENITDDNDGLLTSSEILKLDFNNDLIMLSACNTASSDGSSSSESLSGLANSFFYSGARSLLVTHWSIFSKESVELVNNTFQYLDDYDDDLSMSLRRAKIKMLKNSKTEHPVYWAAYSLVGRSNINPSHQTNNNY